MKKFNTDRTWGNKVEPSRTKVKIDGHSIVIIGKDFWEGPVDETETGHYVRAFYFE